MSTNHFITNFAHHIIIAPTLMNLAQFCPSHGQFLKLCSNILRLAKRIIHVMNIKQHRYAP